MGRGDGQVVSELAFYSNYPSLNPAEAYKMMPIKMAIAQIYLIPNTG